MQLSHCDVWSVEFAWNELKMKPDHSQATLRASAAFYRPHPGRTAFAFWVATVLAVHDGVHKPEGSL